MTNLKDETFKLIYNSEHYINIKATKLQDSIMLIITDISPTVLLERQKSHSELLIMMNATTNHELRNPLNSIAAFNTQKDMLYK